jgi:hypothetical protein
MTNTKNTKPKNETMLYVSFVPLGTKEGKKSLLDKTISDIKKEYNFDSFNSFERPDDTKFIPGMEFTIKGNYKEIRRFREEYNQF